MDGVEPRGLFPGIQRRHQRIDDGFHQAPTDPVTSAAPHSTGTSTGRVMMTTVTKMVIASRTVGSDRGMFGSFASTTSLGTGLYRLDLPRSFIARDIFLPDGRKKMEPLPVAVERRLVALPRGYRRGYIDGAI